MSSSPPKIDQRTYEHIVRQVENQLIQSKESPHWQPAPESKDAGRALVRIFARMVKLVSDRINQVPEKNFLTYLNLLGAQLKPPQPAKVPLKFELATGTTTDGLVPAHTQVSAPPAEGSDQEIIFETEHDLVVTTGQLKAVYGREPSRDQYSDRTLVATGQIDALVAAEQPDEAFLVFSSDRPIAHYLYISCPEIFSLPELSQFRLIWTLVDAERASLQNIPLNWAYWNGSKWETYGPDNATSQDNTITFSNFTIPTESEVHGKTARWIRAQLLDMPTNISGILRISDIQGITEVTQSASTPDICLYNSTSLDLTKDFYPFGEQPQRNDIFYIALNDALIKPGVVITINATLSQRPVDIDDNLSIIWEMGNGQVWQEVNAGGNSSVSNVKWANDSQAIQFTEPATTIQAKLQFPNQAQMPSPSNVNGKTHYWIRARINQGHYGKATTKRSYFIYQDVAALVVEAKKDELHITVNRQELLKVGDILQLLPVKDGFPEINKKIIKIECNDNQSKKITLDSEIANTSLAIGTRVQRQSTITETVPPTYDPPLLKSLTLTYHFTLTETAIYGAINDFNYSDSTPFTSSLQQTSNIGDRILNLVNIQGLNVGEFLTIEILNQSSDDGTSQLSQQYQIDAINPETKQVILASAITSKLPKSSLVKRSFQPFLPTLDTTQTLYLGFDQSLNNKPINLFAQIKAPDPNELSVDITEKTFLKVDADEETSLLQPDDITGWQIGDRLRVQHGSNQQHYDSYRIEDINEKAQVTLDKKLTQTYSQETLVLRPTQPALAWEYSSPLGWQSLGVSDETDNFSQSGVIQFIAPEDFVAQYIFGQSLSWVRVRWQDGNYRVPPRLRRLWINTTWGIQALSIKEEILGASNNTPNQSFVANYTPILMGQQLEVQEGQIPAGIQMNRLKVINDPLGNTEAVWVPWQQVSDFYSSGPGHRHYTLDRQTGKIQFGDGQTGMIPPRGRNNIRLSLYRTGGGLQGNVDSHTVTQIKTTFPYIAKVTNPAAAAGGAPQEDLSRLKARVPKQLRHRNRAVTFEDITDLAYEASTDVARVNVVTAEQLTTNFSSYKDKLWLDPQKESNIGFQEILNTKPQPLQTVLQAIHRRSGQVKVIILPDSQDRQPIPSIALLKRIETYLRERCSATMELIVTAPKWQKITVTTTVVPISLENVDSVRSKVKQQLEDFLHPLTGGKGEFNQKGWQFGRYPEKSDFYAIIQSIPEVDYVQTLNVDPSSDESSLSADTLIYSGEHRVSLAIAGGQK